ncbi:hypothetical protein RHS01_09363 [Rhizoctonia solani]|uniref:Uncharacterized protein n=1 Tax=Rhizoctonia solani TaxID=456999 RepID=A0A8H7I455_9AGAM|nr:hypothetical protein RHS01_09363 [Rhizoctonia solani]
MDPLPPQEEFQDSQDADNHMDFDWQSTHTHLDDNTQSASDEEFDENEDGFMDITKEDCREYERWFGEEREQLDKILADTLTEEEMDSFKMLAIAYLDTYAAQL